MLRILKYGFVLFWISSNLALAAQTVEVVVEGIEGEVLKNVQAELGLPPGLVQEGRVDPMWLKVFEGQAPEKVHRALEPFGYYSPRITVSLEAPEEGLFRLRVHVEPGEPVRVSSIKLEVRGPGSQEQKLQNRVKGFPLKDGDILHQDKYEEAKGALKSEALELGYLDADFPVHEIRVSQAERKAEIELVLETGQQYSFGEVSFAGGSTYPGSFLRRYLALHTGEVFSYRKIAQTQLRLISSDRFREVSIEAKKEESRDLRVPIRIALTPSPPKRFRFGVGYETDLGPRVSATYKDLNFYHLGHELNSELNLSTRLQGIVTSYVIPGERDIDQKTSVKLAIQREDTDSYVSRSIYVEPEYIHSFSSGDGSLYSLGCGSLGSVFFQARYEDFTVGIQDGHSRLFIPGLRFLRRQYDDLIRPTKGFRYIIETKGAAQALGSTANFLQLSFIGDVMIPLPYRFSFFTRVQAGTTWCQSIYDLPPSIRFFAGGSQSVRGYAYQSLGPKDIFGNVIGGKHLLVGSIEIEKAVSKLFGIAVFYDIGNAFNYVSSMDLQQDVGLGVRIYTPVGPIRLDIARQVNVKEPGFRFDFTVGFQL